MRTAPLNTVLHIACIAQGYVHAQRRDADVYTNKRDGSQWVAYADRVEYGMIAQAHS